MITSRASIKALSKQGNSDWEILTMVIKSGVEFPDAEWLVSDALKMDDEQRQEMVDKYDNCV